LWLWLWLILVALMLMLIDKGVGLSLLWGFSVCLLPAMCFTWYAHHYRGARAMQMTVHKFYRAEAAKFILTTMLFAAVFQQVDKIYPATFFLAFVIAQIFSWVLTAGILRRHLRNKLI
jgi:F0F1-type ATP synthase assembly protein I